MINPAAGGLPALLQGFMQGRQMRRQNQIADQEMQENQQTSAMNFYAREQQLGQQDPELLKDPTWRQQAEAGINQRFKQANMPALGTELPGSFGMTMPSDILSDPAKTQAFFAMTPDERKSAYPNLYDPENNLYHAPQKFLDPKAGEQFIYHMNTEMNKVGDGTLSPQAFQAMIKAQAPTFNLDPDQVLGDLNFDQVAGDATKAKINNMQASGWFTQEKADAFGKEIPDLVAGVHAHTQLTEADVKETVQKTQNLKQEVGLQYAKLQQGWARIQTEQQRTKVMIDNNNLSGLSKLSHDYTDVRDAADKYHTQSAAIKSSIQTTLGANGALAAAAVNAITKDPKTGKWSLDASQAGAVGLPALQNLTDMMNQADDLEQKAGGMDQFVTKYQSYFDQDSDKVAHSKGLTAPQSVKSTTMNVTDVHNNQWTSTDGRTYTTTYKGKKYETQGSPAGKTSFQMTLVE